MRSALPQSCTPDEGADCNLAWFILHHHRHHRHHRHRHSRRHAIIASLRARPTCNAIAASTTLGVSYQRTALAAAPPRNWSFRSALGGSEPASRRTIRRPEKEEEGGRSVLVAMAASTAGLVPITRAFLAKFYDKYPFAPLAPELETLLASVKEHALQAHAARPDAAGSAALIGELQTPAPHKLDENLWRNREQIEEMLSCLAKWKWPKALKTQGTPELVSVAERVKKLEAEMKQCLSRLEAFQKVQSDRIFSMVLTYMPQDFRLAYIKQYRERSEKKKQAEVDNLMAYGGSIHDKYVLLWNQQMDRRRQLAQLGSASGVWKTLVKYLVGCPQVLLEFVCKINDDHGPMEEQRERYGPSLYKLTTFAVALRVFLGVWWSAFDSEDLNRNEMLEVLEQSIKAYKFDFMRYLDFMQEVFKNSPFFITPEEAGLAPEAAAAQDFQETTIAAGKTYEFILPVKYEGALVAWDFRLTSGKDIGFSVEYVDSSKATRHMIPYQKYEAHQGSFQSPCSGDYKLVWDNSYSRFYSKFLRFKVDEIPPVLEEAAVEGMDTSTVTSEATPEVLKSST